MVVRKKIKCLDAYTRRELLKRYGIAGFMLPVLLKETRGFSATSNLKYIQIFKPIGHYSPGGNISSTFYPKGGGSDFTFNAPSLVTSALEPLKSHLIIPKGLKLYREGGNAHGNGFTKIFTNAPSPAPSTRKAVDWQPARGPSVDQVIAEYLYQQNKPPAKSLHFALQAGSRAIDRMSTSASYTSIPYETNPTQMYESVVTRIKNICAAKDPGTGNESAAAMLAARKSLLDFSIKNISDAKSGLDLSNKEISKLDDYSDQLRQIENEISSMTTGTIAGDCNGLPANSNPGQIPQVIKTSMDLLVLALQWDITNVACYQFGGAQSQFKYSNLSQDGKAISSGYHTYSHEGNASLYPKILAKIERFIWQQIAYFLSQLQATSTVGGASLLSQSAVLIGGGEVSYGNAHTNHNMPFIVAGQAGGNLKTGRVISLPGTDKQNSIANLHISMCQAMGMKDKQVFGEAKNCYGPIL